MTARRERLCLGGLCLLAALHVFIYAAAFPFFNNVDEPAHFATVVQYAHGELPRRLEPYAGEVVRDLALYQSTFYFGTNGAKELLPPPWTRPSETQAAWIASHSAASASINYEGSQPPLYYTLAGSWWRLSGRLGIGEASRLYGLRFLNCPIVMLITWLGWLTARQVFPQQVFPRLAVPAFIALMPQSAFYSVQNDVLSPLFSASPSSACCGFGRRRFPAQAWAPSPAWRSRPLSSPRSTTPFPFSRSSCCWAFWREAAGGRAGWRNRCQRSWP